MPFRSMDGWGIGEEDTLTVVEDLRAFQLGGGWGERIFTPARPGLHRIRVLAKGRSIDYDGVCEEPVEEFELTIWPVDTREPRLTSGKDG